MLNYVLGKYIAFSSNDPKKYPKQPFLGYTFGSDKKSNGIMSNEDMEAVAKMNNLKLGGTNR